MDVDMVARRLAQGSARYLDCRSEQEFATGVVAGAVNCPFPHNNHVAVEPDDFVADVEGEFGRDDTILLGCRSGVRSLLAAEVLLSAGFSDVTNVAGGILAWEAAGHPIAPFKG
eukprot:COSAG01_NODE_23513_length_812_cov_1.546985_1_plen_114_part_00